MKKATVRDLRYPFSAIEATLRQGEEIEIRKRKRVIGRLVPVRPKVSAYPNFAAQFFLIGTLPVSAGYLAASAALML